MGNQVITHQEHHQECPYEKVVLNITVTGARERIIRLLEEMDSVKGLSVLKGSFKVNNVVEK